jgi:hypothetical protein
MSVSVRIDETIYEEAKNAAQAEFRSIPQQIEFWAKVGKCALDNPDLPIEFIKDIIAAKRLSKSVAEPFKFGE